MGFMVRNSQNISEISCTKAHTLCWREEPLGSLLKYFIYISHQESFPGHSILKEKKKVERGTKEEKNPLE